MQGGTKKSAIPEPLLASDEYDNFRFRGNEATNEQTRDGFPHLTFGRNQHDHRRRLFQENKYPILSCGAHAHHAIQTIRHGPIYLPIFVKPDVAVDQK